MLLLRLISLAVVLSVATLSNVTAVSTHGECRPDPFGGDVAHELAARYPGNQITAHVYDARTGCEYSLNRDNRQSTASVFKVMVMAGTLLEAQREDRDLTDWEMSRLTPDDHQISE